MGEEENILYYLSCAPCSFIEMNEKLKKNVCVQAKANNQRQLAVPVVKDYTYLWLG